MNINNEENEILRLCQWRENKTLFCRDYSGEIFRFKRNYETLTGNSKKALFVKANNHNGTIYERKIKMVKNGNRTPAEIEFSKDYNEKQFKSNKAKIRYRILGYRFTPFPSENKTTTTKIDEKPFIERFAHSSYRNMLLADIKVIFGLKHEHSVELSEFLSDIQDCYQKNLEGLNPSEIGKFLCDVKTLIETAKTRTGKHLFSINKEGNQTSISKN